MKKFIIGGALFSGGCALLVYKYCGGLALLVCFAGLVWRLRQKLQGGVWIDAWVPSRCTKKDLNGRVALVTGCTVGGVGCATAVHLARRGCSHLILTCRSAEKAEAAKRVVEQAAPAGRRIQVQTLLIDFCDRESVRAAAAAVTGELALTEIDYLVLNAGISHDPAPDGKARVWQVNHIGPFQFSEALRPLLRAAAAARRDVRVVTVSSGIHKAGCLADNPYEPGRSDAYAQSKLANVLHARELQRQLRDEEERAQSYPTAPPRPPSLFRCFAVSPGVTATTMWGFGAKAAPTARSIAWRTAMTVMCRPPSVGARSTVTALLDDALLGGEYLTNCTPAPHRESPLANDPAEWARCWRVSEACVADGRF